jgi:hypothetical protein
LCRDGEDDDFVKVPDFGIVKASDQPGTPEGAANVVSETTSHSRQRRRITAR